MINSLFFCSVAQLCPTLCTDMAAHQASLSSTSSQSLLKLMSIESVMPPNYLILCCPLLSCLQSFPSSGSYFLMSHLIATGGQSIGASTSALVLRMNIQYWFLLGLTGLISCSPRDTQGSFPIPQFKSINSSAFSLLYGPTVISIHDYWKNHNFH